MNSFITKVVRFHKAGDASVLKIEELPVAEPSEYELRFKVKAIGLNRAEVMFRNGAYLETPQFPSRLGYEAAGVVDAVGKSVTNFKVGDRVSSIPAFSMGQYGVYAEHVVLPANAVAKCPESFTAQQSASIWMQYITAYGAMIEIGQLKQGQRVLITAASSSVGVAAIQIAKSQGAIVIATTRGKNKKQFLLEQGADYVIQTDAEDLVTIMADITQDEGAELIFDPIGGPILSQLAEASSKSGRIIEYGALDSEPTPYPLFTALAKGLIIQGYTLFEITQDKNRLENAKKFLYPLFNTKKLIPIIDKVFAFNDIQQAHKYMEANQQMGKIVISVQGNINW
ncbi:MAG: zinc-dependent alcohol dehydrogenase family protein [Gammaproteobacteria bacterium]|nr:zinc-dependent alcohol dehydrogenase family protein [Gammaproteobacteria bacterium]